MEFRAAPRQPITSRDGSHWMNLIVDEAHTLCVPHKPHPNAYYFSATCAPKVAQQSSPPGAAGHTFTMDCDYVDRIDVPASTVVSLTATYDIQYSTICLSDAVVNAMVKYRKVVVFCHDPQKMMDQCGLRLSPHITLYKFIRSLKSIKE